VLFSLFIILRAFSVARIMSLLIISKVSNVYIRIKVRPRRSRTITKVILIILLVFFFPRTALLRAALKRARTLRG
jgi:hypothetical protein